MKKRYFVICGVLVLAALVIAISAYPRLPELMPVHWNIEGQVDRYGARWMVFLGPALMAGLMLLFAVIPSLSPKPFAVDSFRSTYWYLMLVVVGMIGAVHLIVLWGAMEGTLDIRRAMFGVTAAFMALIGNVLGKVRRNFWIGIRTPWTLASEKVWYATHRFAAKAMVATSVLALIAVLARLPIPVCLTLLIAGPVLALVYSLVYFKRLQRSGQLETE